MRKTLYDYCRELGDTALLEEWDSEKNELTPLQVTYGSKKKLWWVCGSGHSYQASATSRTGERTGCPLLYGPPAHTGRERPRHVVPGHRARVGWRKEPAAHALGRAARQPSQRVVAVPGGALMARLDQIPRGRAAAARSAQTAA